MQRSALALEAPASTTLRATFAALLSVAVGAASGCDAPPPSELRLDPERPNVVLVTLDTTRPDHLGCYGYERPTSPNLDRLCAESAVYTRAYSTSSWTLPAHASLFTGRFTRSHGARYDSEGPLVLSDVIPERSARRYRARGLDPRYVTLAERMGESGYRSAGFVGGPWMKRVFGLADGFDIWDDTGISEENGRLAAELTDRALEFVGAHRDQPFLLFLNYYDAHFPYGAPGEWRARFLDGAPPDPRAEMTLEQAIGLYDGEIAYTDHHFGRLLDGLRSWGLYDSAWIIVTADHGDVFGEHGVLGHGRFLWEEEIRIPLVVKRPGIEPSREDAPVQLTDLMPWLLGELGLAAPVGLSSQGPIVAELYPLPMMFAKGDWKVLIDRQHKLHWNSRGRHRLHDLDRPGAEDDDRAQREPERVAEMVDRLDALLEAQPAPLPAAETDELDVDEETRRALEGLGYLDDPGSEGDQD